MNDSTQPLVLQLSGISKSFPGVKALQEVNFSLRKGEVHALCGENGAGKSTLMNILAGNQQPDSGEIIVQGQPVTIKGPNHAGQLGIGIVYQERSLVNGLNVAENIFANQHPRNAFGLIDRHQLFGQTQQLLDQLELFQITPQTLVGGLSAGQKQMVEIAKALARNPRILILDEPTASITERETVILFRLIASLTQRGVSVIYISHRMAEIFEIADRVTVLKDGKYQGTNLVAEIGPPDVIRMMVGRDLTEIVYKSQVSPEPVLEVVNLSGRGFSGIHFSVRKGETLALSGLVGAGRTEIARAIFGADPKYSGEIRVNGKPCTIRHPSDAIAHRIGYVPEERKDQGLFLQMTVAENIAAGQFASGIKAVFLDSTEHTKVAHHYKEQLRIATPHVQQKVTNLSGGNQQKVVLAKWLHLQPTVLIVDEPTHGIDVGAKAEIYQLLRQFTQKGAAVVLISSELPEVLTLADRILVIYQGTIAAELPGRDTTEEEIMHYASGIKTQSLSA